MKAVFKYSLLSLALFYAFSPSICYGGVYVHDALALKNEEVIVKAETKGIFLPKGGEMVEFFVNGKSLGRVLSGGDGAAYRSFTPEGRGLYKVTAKHGDESGEGRILSVKKGRGLVFIDVEGSLFSNPFSSGADNESRQAIKNIMKIYPVVYLETGFMGAPAIKALLREGKMPESVVLPWNSGEIFSELNEKGLKIKAVVGGGAVIESAGQYKPKAFSFEEVEGAEQVDGWKEIVKKLTAE